MHAIWPYIAALLPTIGLAWLFYVIMKGVLEGDRRERLAQSRWEAAREAAEKSAEEKTQS